jgi:hypothetical protein
MTLVARDVLADCWCALSLLEDETDARKWRVHWAAAVALTRAVGSVLDKVDGVSDPVIQTIQKAAFKRWIDKASVEHHIFRRFIDQERNSVLKEYRSTVYGEAEIPLAVVCEAGVVQEFGAEGVLDENLYRPMEDGPWAGEDARDVLRSALQWWDRELTAIEIAVAEVRSQNNS